MVPKTIETRILLLSLVAVLVTEGAISIVSSEAFHLSVAIVGVARVMEMVFLLLIVSIWGKGMSSIGLAPHEILTGLKKGLLWSAGFGICTLLGFVVLYMAHVNPLGLIKTPLPSSAGETALFFVVGGLVAPIAEEVFFRGILYGFFRKWGVLVALAGSTLLFVLAHATSSGISLTHVVGGMVFAVAYEMTGNLMAPITIHVLGNNAIFCLSLVL
jgi:membrane protease YdiL (CAAX protease family)